MWFFSGKKRKEEETKRREAREVEDEKIAAERKRRSKDAERRILDRLRDARASRQAIEAAEAKACETMEVTRRNTDTAVRKVQQKQSEISGEFVPVNGEDAVAAD